MPKELHASQKYILLTAISFSIFILISLLFSLHRIKVHGEEKALAEAKSIFELNLAYRRWNAFHGGVYVPVTDQYQPSPYLAVHPKRDIIGTDGTRLTVVNPAIMTRHVHEILSKTSPLPIISKVTSLKYFNPDNKPDAWEEKALTSFEKGNSEASELVDVKGHPYMRLLKPYMAEKGCLVCHAWQGYKEGDVRGGLSIGVPMQPHLERAAGERKDAYLSHLLIWIIGMGGIALLGTIIRRAEHKLVENEWKFRILAESSYDWEYWLTEDNRILFMSPSAETITGYTAETFISNPKMLTDIMHPEDKHVCTEHMANFRASIHEQIEFRILAKDGSVKWLSHVCAPIYVKDTFLGRRVSNRDVTETKTLEEQLIQAQKMEALGHLASGVSHDFNNLLSVIMGYSSMLQEQCSSMDDESKRYLQTIIDASEKARAVTSDLLAFSRRQVLTPRQAGLNSVMRETEIFLSRMIGTEHELKIRYAADDIPVFVDPNKMEQALINLAINARDAMQKGGVISLEAGRTTVNKETAALHHVKAGDYAVLSVSDSGSGMSQQTLQHIFEPFFTTKETGKGTGLGLAIVYGIVNQHNGFISVHSELNVGTTFSIHIPVAERIEEQGPEKMEEPPDVRGTETILVAEDEEALRGLIAVTLGKFGYNVVAATDGEDAERQYHEHGREIALLLLDISMPKKNGLEVFHAIRAANPKIKAIFMSGHAQDILTKKGIYEEGLDFVPKPIELDKLLAKIRNRLDHG